MLYLVRGDREIVGAGHHRAGWPYVFSHLRKLESRSADAVNFDDFVERSFCYDPVQRPYTQPWVGILHHPPDFDFPWIGEQEEKWESIFSTGMWKQSVRNLKAAIFTSLHQANGFDVEGVSKYVIYHPTDLDVPWFNPDSYISNKNKKLIQLGFYLRNTRLIHQIPDTRGLERTKVLQRKSNSKRLDAKCKNFFSSVPEYPGVRRIDRWNDLQYDAALSKNLLITQPLGCSANNVIIEAMARKVPVICPRHPAIEEYIGPSYPLYFDEIGEIPGLIDRWHEGYEFLKIQSYDFLHIDNFIKDIAQVANNVRTQLANEREHQRVV